MTREGSEIVILGDVIQCNPQTKLNKGEEYNFLPMENIKTGCYKFPVGYERKTNKSGGAKFQDNDTVFARITPCLQNGKICKIEGIGKGFGSTEYFVFRAKDGVTDSDYVFYLMCNPYIRNLAEKSMVGASGRQRANIKVIEELEISLPPLPEQQRIASILSTYDDLIENNTRRIALLEQMAQTLYRQWFVEYKFPGYQDVEMVDSGTEFGRIPSGWEVKVSLKDLISINKGISYKGSELSDSEGIHFVNLKCFIRGGGFRNDGIKKYTGSYKNEKILKPGDLVMAVTDMTQAREIVARVAMVPDLDGDITMSCDVVKIVPENIDKTYLYYMLRFSGFSDTIKEMANGANVLHLRPDSIYEYPIIIPSKSVTEVFKNQCGVIVDEMGSLEKQNQSLKEQRDVLLHKLIG